MKIFIKKIVLLIFLFIALNYLYVLLLSYFDYNFKKSLEAYRMTDESFTCLVFGNSFVMDGIDTGYLNQNGISSYNFAIGGANLKSNYIQFKTYLDNNKKPKIVLLGLERLDDFNSPSDESIHPIIEFNYHMFNFVNIKNLPLLKFKWLSMELLKQTVSKDHRNATLINGQYQIEKKVPDNTQYRSNPMKKIDLNSFKNAKYLVKIDSICEVNDIKLYVLGMPGYKNTQNEIAFGLHKLKERDININFINLNNRYFVNKTLDDKNDWLANSHLNKFGARKLTKRLLSEILNDLNNFSSEYPN